MSSSSNDKSSVASVAAAKTQKSRLSTTAKAIYVSEKKPKAAAHSMDSLMAVFLFQIFPTVVALTVSLYHQKLFCIHGGGAKVDKKRGDGACYNASAGYSVVFTWVLFYIAAYYLRKEQLEKKNLLLMGVTKGVKMSYVGLILYGTPLDKHTIMSPDEYEKLLLGTLPGHRLWNLRGSIFLPLIATVLSSVYSIRTVYHQGYMDKSYLLSYFVYVFIRTYILFLQIRCVFFPFILLCILVGYTAKDRVGLWNHNDTALSELQTVSMHGVIWCAVITLSAFFNAYYFRDYLGSTTDDYVSLGLSMCTVLLVMLFLPILPVILILREMRSKAKFAIQARLEVFNRCYLNCELSGEGDAVVLKAKLDQLISYYEYVSNTRTIPSAVEVFNTTIFSILMTLLPVVLVLVFT
jgi:hypothetical protein